MAKRLTASACRAAGREQHLSRRSLAGRALRRLLVLCEQPRAREPVRTSSSAIGSPALPRWRSGDGRERAQGIPMRPPTPSRPTTARGVHQPGDHALGPGGDTNGSTTCSSATSRQYHRAGERSHGRHHPGNDAGPRRLDLGRRAFRRLPSDSSNLVMSDSNGRATCSFATGRPARRSASASIPAGWKGMGFRSAVDLADGRYVAFRARRTIWRDIERTASGRVRPRPVDQHDRAGQRRSRRVAGERRVAHRSDLRERAIRRLLQRGEQPAGARDRHQRRPGRVHPRPPDRYHRARQRRSGRAAGGCAVPGLLGLRRWPLRGLQHPGHQSAGSGRRHEQQQRRLRPRSADRHHRARQRWAGRRGVGRVCRLRRDRAVGGRGRHRVLQPGDQPGEPARHERQLQRVRPRRRPHGSARHRCQAVPGRAARRHGPGGGERHQRRHHDPLPGRRGRRSRRPGAFLRSRGGPAVRGRADAGRAVHQQRAVGAARAARRRPPARRDRSTPTRTPTTSSCSSGRGAQRREPALRCQRRGAVADLGRALVSKRARKAN